MVNNNNNNNQAAYKLIVRRNDGYFSNNLSINIDVYEYSSI